MIVTAASYNFKEIVRPFISSLIRNGEIDTEDFIFFIFDLSFKERIYRDNCLKMFFYLKMVNSKINTEIIPFSIMHAIIEKFKKNKFFVVNTITDYLRAFIYSYIKSPYLWIDSDMIVRKEIYSLYKTCKNKNILAMALDNVIITPYFNFYFYYTNRELNDFLKNVGTLNTGLIFVPKDYIKLWQEIFCIVHRYYSKDIPKEVVGQGIWNVIFWVEKAAYVLGEEFNTIYHNATVSMKEKAALLHFAGSEDKNKIFLYHS